MKRLTSTRLLFLALFLGMPAVLSAQQLRTVTGYVTVRETDQPFPGVRVSVRGTVIRTVTDDKGAFTLRVSADAATLVFTYLGYRAEEVPVSDRVTVEMTRMAIGIEGIVVTGLGVQREKQSLGYAVQDLEGDELAKVPELNLVNSLHGTVAGVQITDAGPTGGSARIVIRGASSISGNNQPLFVVDGVPLDNSSGGNAGFGGLDYGNAIQDIDPANIQAISVLKSPAAAALYGSRAANGAIVITTKSGQAGTGTGLGMTASFSYTAETPLRLPNYQNEYGQGLFGEFQWVDGAGAGLWDFVDESWGPRLDGRLIDQFTGTQQPWVAQPDNIRSFFRTGGTLNSNIAISRASENSHVRLSLTNTSVRGMTPANTHNRRGLALKGGSNLSERLSVEASVNYIFQRVKNRPGTGYDEDNPMQSFIWFGRQVDMDALRDFTCDGNEVTPCNADGGQFNWNYNYHNNPFWETFVNSNNDERDRLFGHLSVFYQLNDWITASGRVGRDWFRDHRKRRIAPNSLDDAGQGSFTEETLYRAETNLDLALSATRQLSDITIDVTAGANLRKNGTEEIGVSVSRLTVPGIYTIDNAAATPNPSDFVSNREVRSLYGSLSLNYAGYFNVDLTGRNDWSSTLPQDANSYFYSSVSSAFVFSDAFDMESSFFSSGKLRASWAQVGNDAEPYQLASVFSSLQAYGTTPLFAVPNAIANVNLKPEETTAYELGTDLGFLDERLGFALTYYRRSTTNQILAAQISRGSGFTSQVLNAGEVENRGWELLLMANPVRNPGGFSWDMTVNWSKNTSEVTELFGDLETLVLGSYWSLNIEARLGEPYGVFFGNGYLRDDQGNLLLTAAGMPQRDPVRRILGNYNPDWIGGIQNRFSYGSFDLSVLVDGQAGGDIFSVTNWFGEYAGVLESSLRGRETDFCDPGIIQDGILPDGTRNTTQVVCPQDFFGRNFGINEASIDDASYIKLREVRLGYELPTEWVSWLGFSGGNFALIGRNLALWSNIENIDPETSFDASNVQGIEFGQFPTARSIGFALSLR